MKKYKAVIIGAGNIGAFYSKPDNNNGILTHAHAYKACKKIKLGAFVDIDKKKALKASKVWQVQAYTDINNMFVQEKPDIVSVCSPDKIHHQNLLVCLKYKPKLVFCEKPFTTNLKSGQKIINGYKKAKVLLAVNYIRRWNQALINLKQEINSLKFGRLLNMVAIYNKGILHNGSHLVDLLRFFFGEISQTTTLGKRIDYQPSDPTVDGFLKFTSGNVCHLVAADARKYEIFELEMLFAKAKIRLLNSGQQIEYFQVINNPQAKGYKMLKFIKRETTSLTSTLIKIVENLVNTLENKEKLLYSASEALKTEALCIKLSKSNE